MQVTVDFRNTALANLIATNAVLDPAKTFLGVGTAVADHGLATLLADITVPTGAMAARRAITAWSAVSVLPSGLAVVDGPLMRFAPAVGDAAQSLQVWYLADALTGGNLLAFGSIHPPPLLPDPASSWSIICRVTLDPTGTWSAEVTFAG